MVCGKKTITLDELATRVAELEREVKELKRKMAPGGTWTPMRVIIQSPSSVRGILLKK